MAGGGGGGGEPEEGENVGGFLRIHRLLLAEKRLSRPVRTYWEAVPKGAAVVEPRVAGVGKAPGSAFRWRRRWPWFGSE